MYAVNVINEPSCFGKRVVYVRNFLFWQESLRVMKFPVLAGKLMHDEISCFDRKTMQGMMYVMLMRMQISKHFLETSRFRGKVVHEAMYAMHVRMQIGD